MNEKIKQLYKEVFGREPSDRELDAFMKGQTLKDNYSNEDLNKVNRAFNEKLNAIRNSDISEAKANIAGKEAPKPVSQPTPQPKPVSVENSSVPSNVLDNVKKATQKAQPIQAKPVSKPAAKPVNPQAFRAGVAKPTAKPNYAGEKDEFDYSDEASTVDMNGPTTEEMYSEKMGIPSEKNIETPEQVDRAILEHAPDATSEELDSLNADANLDAKADEKPSLKDLRKKFANDNEAYKEAAANEGYDTDKRKGQIKSIMDAYYDGELDKASRDYLIADTLGSFARNMGKSMANIGAAYSGGSIDNSTEKPMWQGRAEGVFNAGTEAAANKVEGSTQNANYQSAMQGIKAAKLSNEQKDKALAAAREIEKAMSSTKDPIERKVLAGILSNMSQGQVGEPEFIALGAEGVKEVLSKKGGIQVLNSMFAGEPNRTGAEQKVYDSTKAVNEEAKKSGSLTKDELGFDRFKSKVYSLLTDEDWAALKGHISNRELSNLLMMAGSDMTPEAAAEWIRSSANTLNEYNNVD